MNSAGNVASGIITFYSHNFTHTQLADSTAVKRCARHPQPAAIFHSIPIQSNSIQLSLNDIDTNETTGVVDGYQHAEEAAGCQEG